MRLTRLVVSVATGHGKPANLRLRAPIYIEGDSRLAWLDAFGGRENGDWRVSHGALPGL